MNNAVIEFLFKYHRGVIAPMPASKGIPCVEEKYVYSANLKLSQDGFTMSKELIDACLKASHKDFMILWGVLSKAASKYRTLIERTKPIWPNFPTDAMEASLVELYVVNLLHFLSAGEWAPGFDVTKVAPGLIMPTASLKVIPAANEDSAAELVAEMYMRNTPLSAEEAADIAAMMKNADVADKVYALLQGKTLKCKESIALYVKDSFPFGKTNNDTVVKQVNSARDVLRIAAAMSGGDVSLATVSRYKSFNRNERRFLLELIEHTSCVWIPIAEAMSKNREEWKRLGEKLHPGEYRIKYPNTFVAFSMVRSNAYIETFESKLQLLMKQPVKVMELCQHMVKRPGVYARNLDFALRNCKDLFSAYTVVSFFESVAASVDIRILMQMVNHFRNRNLGIQLATGKKSGASTHVKEKTVAQIPQEIIDAVVKSLSNVISSQLKARDGKKIYIDPNVLNGQKIVFPVNARQMSFGEKVYSSGSAMPIPADMDTVRAFLYWKGKDNGGRGYEDDIDLDLSMMFLDENFKAVDTVAYFNPACRIVDGIHSGDRRYSGKDGAVEYIDFSLNTAQQNGVAYAVIAVNSFSGSLFSELTTAFCGWMSRDGETGKQFESQTVQNRFDLASDSREQASVLIDIANRKCFIVDMALHQNARYGNIANAQSEIESMAKFIVQDNSLTLNEVLEMTGRVVTSPEEAEIIITDNGDYSTLENTPRIVNPWDVTAISELVLPSSVE